MRTTPHPCAIDPILCASSDTLRIMPEYHMYTLLSIKSNEARLARRVPAAVRKRMGDGEFFVVSYLRGRGDALEYMERVSMATSCDLTGALLHLYSGFVDVMHRRGLWHMDIKLENLVLTTDRARLIDFGLALTFEDGMEFPTYDSLDRHMSPLTILATVMWGGGRRI